MKSEQEIISELIKNPAYDSEWVKYAANILATKEEFSEEDLAKYNAGQLEVIAASLEFEYLSVIMNPELNATQMHLVAMVASSEHATDVIVNKIADPSIEYIKLNYVGKALMDGHTDILIYLDQGFDAEQLAVIASGMEDGINYQNYALKCLSAAKMNVIRLAMINDLSIELTPDMKIIIG